MTVKKFSLLLLISLLTVGLLAACGDNNNDNEGKKNDVNEAGNAEVELPEPDLEGIPDVVAEVNGEEITKDDFTEIYTEQFNQVSMYAQMSGEPVDEDELKKQVVNSIVERELFFQEADKRFPEASQEGIDKLFEELITQFEVESKEELLDLYKENGVEEAELMENIELQVRINHLMDEEVGEIVIDEKDIKDTYDIVAKEQEEANKDAEEPAEVPPYDEVKDLIKDQLKQEKEIEALQKVIDSLREKADIKVHL